MPSNTPDENLEKYITLIESQKIIDNRYADIKRIDSKGGDGHFSVVFTAEDTKSKKNRKVALKFLNPSFMADEYSNNCFHREVKMLERLNGQRNILPIVQGRSEFKLLFKIEEPIKQEISIPFVYYVSHLADSSIRNYIINESNYLRNILHFREMCKAVQRIHSSSICHRDLKPNNFLIYGKRYVCLSDFGTARLFGEEYTPLKEVYKYPVGDFRYKAPELLCGLYFSDYHNCCADIYSLGTILFELFTKIILGSEIYDDSAYISSLIAHFNKVPEKNRKYVFDEVIQGMAESKQLPSVALYDSNIPKDLVFHIDRLYQGMANLDYRKRIINFQEIFNKINMCQKIIEHRISIEHRKKLKLLKKR